MAISSQFQEKVNLVLEDIDPDTLHYEESEYWMIQSAYEYIEFYATRHCLLNTAIALPLARGLHNGDHRKLTLIKGDISYRLPYVIHPLMVCKMLIELRIPMSDQDLDILLAAALCHDMIEDIPFMDNGKELMILYHLDKRVYDIVKLVSKRKEFTEEETRMHFEEIAKNPMAAFVKLSDRSNNVEDLYNMSARKVREYVHETETYVLPICEKAKSQYPEYKEAFDLLGHKITCLIGAASVLVERYEEQEAQLREQVEELRQENTKLRKKWMSLWKV